MLVVRILEPSKEPQLCVMRRHAVSWRLWCQWTCVWGERTVQLGLHTVSFAPCVSDVSNENSGDQ